MKFLDITGLKQVISKLQEWTQKKQDKKANTTRWQKYKKKKKTVQHIIGRALPLTIDTSSQENWYWFENNLPIRVKRRYKNGLTNDNRNTIITFDKLLSNIGNVSISLYITLNGYDFQRIDYDKGELDCTNVNHNASLLTLKNTLVFDPMTGERYGRPVGVTLLRYTLTENSLELYVKIRTDNPLMIKFNSKTLCYISDCRSNIKKTYHPNIINTFSNYASYIDKPILSSYVANKLCGWGNKKRSYGKKSILLKRRHSVRIKTINPATGKLIKIRTAPRFTKVRFNNNFDVSIDKGYYMVYVAYNHLKKYIGDIVVSAHRWKIENGKRKIDRYKIKGV